MTCSHCRNRLHNINSCTKFIIDRLNSILNLGTDFHLRNDTDGKWFKDRNGLTPNQDNYEITNSIQIIKNQEDALTATLHMMSNITDMPNISNVDKKRKLNLTTTIKHAMLLKYFPLHPDLESVYISKDGYKIKYENNLFIIEVLNDDEMVTRYTTGVNHTKRFNRFIATGRHLNDIYQTIFIKLRNSISDPNGDDFFNYLKNAINPDDTFVITLGGIRPEIERQLEEQDRENNEIIRRATEDRIRIREEQRRIRDQRQDIYRQEYQERQRLRLEETRLRHQELSRSLEEKKSKLILKINVIETAECPVCFDELGKTNKAILRCGHQFCSDCIFTHLQKARGSDCPCCRAEYVIRPLGWLPPRETA